MTPTVAVVRLPEGEGLPLPAYMTAGAAGADVVAAIAGELVLVPGGRALIPTGFALEVPPGFEVQVRPRSGLAVKHGVTLLNSPGTIDSDYRGPVCVVVVNHGSEPFVVRRGDRIAQLVVAPVVQAAFREAAALGASARGEGGFGSTGTA
ncbi:MAG: dUTP diphosphatase [Candidatus Eremiobacteraeota bacterium]|nr:dUTP diphosphatase [Candidatus Eremiobacteraeota bacterium]MBV8370019.1 dUTP diphosphatase [Candidatus Eremiobacteraeota bacterium]